MKKLIVHAGIPKTGSTSLQIFLSREEDVLLNDGVLYPKNGRELYSSHYNIFKSFVDYLNDNNKLNELDSLLSQLRAEFFSAEIDTILISCEMFCYVTNSQPWLFLVEKLSVKEVIFIVYSRNEYQWLKSWHKQAIKMNTYKKSFNDFCSDNDYKYPLNNFLTSVGSINFGENVRSKVIIVDYDKVDKINFLSNFLNIIDLDSSGYSLNTFENENLPLSLELLCIIRRINELGLDSSMRELIVDRIISKIQDHEFKFF